MHGAIIDRSPPLVLMLAFAATTHASETTRYLLLTGDGKKGGEQVVERSDDGSVRVRYAIENAKAESGPIELLIMEGSEFRVIRVDYHGRLRYPKLERIEGTPDLLTQILAARAK